MKSQKDFTFNNTGEIVRININQAELKNILNNTEAFLTSGCPGCNRPYYTSKPSGPIYNYPRKVKESENEEIYNILQSFVN
jgi:biotin synthase